MVTIGRVGAVAGPKELGLPLPAENGGKETDFGAELDRAIRAVDAAQVDAASHVRRVASGEDVDLHGTMIALEKANISLRAMGSVRDKLVDAYQTIWNMPI
jgi:flagellar hook-basal body complex protein FliE